MTYKTVSTRLIRRAGLQPRNQHVRDDDNDYRPLLDSFEHSSLLHDFMLKAVNEDDRQLLKALKVLGICGDMSSYLDEATEVSADTYHLLFQMHEGEQTPEFMQHLIDNRPPVRVIAKLRHDIIDGLLDYVDDAIDSGCDNLYMIWLSSLIHRRQGVNSKPVMDILRRGQRYKPDLIKHVQCLADAANHLAHMPNTERELSYIDRFLTAYDAYEAATGS